MESCLPTEGQGNQKLLGAVVDVHRGDTLGHTFTTSLRLLHLWQLRCGGTYMTTCKICVYSMSMIARTSGSTRESGVQLSDSLWVCLATC